jgi:hypothetical protein
MRTLWPKAVCGKITAVHRHLTVSERAGRARIGPRGRVIPHARGMRRPTIGKNLADGITVDPLMNSIIAGAKNLIATQAVDKN